MCAVCGIRGADARYQHTGTSGIAPCLRAHVCFVALMQEFAASLSKTALKVIEYPSAMKVKSLRASCVQVR